MFKIETAAHLAGIHPTFSKCILSKGMTFADFVEDFCKVEGSTFTKKYQGAIAWFSFEDGSILFYNEDTNSVGPV